jgi:hypothetical protein
MLRKAAADGVQSGESSFEEAAKPTPVQALQRFENYELVTGEDGKPVELGRGAMGITYKALDVDLRCPVSLKVINERYLGQGGGKGAPFERRLRESSLQALLRELAAFNTGLCVITTRAPVADIADHERTSALRRNLEQLTSDAGAQLLRALGVEGHEEELRRASDEFGGHCLCTSPEKTDTNVFGFLACYRSRRLRCGQGRKPA